MLTASRSPFVADSQKKERPQGNDQYVRRAPKSPKDANFVYDVSISFDLDEVVLH